MATIEYSYHIRYNIVPHIERRWFGSQVGFFFQKKILCVVVGVMFLFNFTSNYITLMEFLFEKLHFCFENH